VNVKYIEPKEELKEVNEEIDEEGS